MYRCEEACANSAADMPRQNIRLINPRGRAIVRGGQDSDDLPFGFRHGNPPLGISLSATHRRTSAGMCARRKWQKGSA